MKHLVILFAAVILTTLPARAATPEVEAAITALQKIESDPAKFQTFCRLAKELAGIGEQDVAQNEALDKQLEDLLRSIGSDVLHAWDIGSDLNPHTPDGEAFENAINAIEEKCGD